MTIILIFQLMKLRSRKVNEPAQDPTAKMLQSLDSNVSGLIPELPLITAGCIDTSTL